MDLKKISFCNTTCYNICSNSFKEKLLKQIQSIYDINLKEKTIRLYDDSRHSNILYKNNYLMSIKSIGNTYLLYLTKIDGVNSCFLIDKKILKGYSFPRIILVKYRFSEDLFNDSILEGDLIKSTSGWKFVIGDIWVYKNKNIKTMLFHKRFSILGEIFTKLYLKDEYLEPCSIFLKNYFPYNKNGKDKILKMLDIIDYKAQGICFTYEKEYKPSFLVFLDPNNRGNPINRVNNNIQNTKKGLKSSNENYIQDVNNTDNGMDTDMDKEDSISSLDISIDTINNKNEDGDGDEFFHLKISKTQTPGIYQLYCNKVGKTIKHSIARIDGLSCLKFVQGIFNHDSDQPLVKCKYDNNFKKFIPIEISNKKYPDEYTDIIYFSHEKM